MKPYGRNKQHPGNQPDNHPKKGWVNWWEVETPKVKSRKRERQSIKKEIKGEIHADG